MEREAILRALRAQININGHIIGAAVGSGMTARYTQMGGADLILAISAGRYRIMGRSSYASFLCYGNSNEMSMQLGTVELLPLLPDIPILFGLNATDPTIHLYDYLKQIQEAGFSGIVNYPTISVIDGQFRQALEEDGICYSQEAEAIKLAHYLNLFTISFVTNEEEATQMLDAGTDVICVHLGMTKGGVLGAKKNLPLHEATKIADRIYHICEQKNPDVIRMIYAGPANTPIDMQYVYQNTHCQGYIGGSTFDRLPSERAIINTTRSFKEYGKFDDPVTRILYSNWNGKDCSANIKSYIEEHYMEDIQLGDIAIVANMSASYLSSKFKKENGISFTEYLVRFRINKAKEYLAHQKMYCKEVATAVGYRDYVQFSKMFKKYVGQTPTEYQKLNP